MALVVGVLRSFTCTPMRLSTNGMSHICHSLPNRSWLSFTDPGGIKGSVGLGTIMANNSLPRTATWPLSELSAVQTVKPRWVTGAQRLGVELTTYQATSRGANHCATESPTICLRQTIILSLVAARSELETYDKPIMPLPHPMWVPRLRIDPLRLLAGCRKSRLKQAPLNLRGIIWLVMMVWTKRGNINININATTIAQCNTLVVRCFRQLIGPANWVLSHWDPYAVISLEAVAYS